jgi:hypothetical protein
MTEPDDHVKARDFVDSILEVNREHGVDEESAVIEYDVAVNTAVETFRALRDDATDTSAAEPA